MLAQVFPIGRSLPSNRQLIGGKATGLGELIRAGANVPGGLVVSIEPGATNFDTSQLRDLVEAHLALANLAPDYAVRSSTVLEDSQEASYAGMFETYLNVGPGDVWTAIEACVDAIRSDRVSAYQRVQKVADEEPVVVPIIVQAMVAASAAGVGFSSHPVTEEPGIMVVEAIRGLGEALVSGQTTPDLYEIRSSTSRIVHSESGDHDFAGRVLAESQVLAVVELMVSMRRHLDFEVDVEFAFEGDELFALQVRPITTLARGMRARGVA